MSNLSSSFEKEFHTNQAKFLGNNNANFNHYRQSAFDFFSKHGLPTRQLEDWKYTDLTPLNSHVFECSLKKDSLDKKSVSPFLLDANYSSMIFINGHYYPDLSSLKQHSDKVLVSSLSSAIHYDPAAIETLLANDLPFSNATINALNAAFINDGCIIKLPDNEILDQPIQLLFIATSAHHVESMHHLRNYILMGKNTKASIIEHYVNLTDTPYLRTVRNDFILQENAAVQHIKLQQESHHAYHISTTHAHLQKNSCINSFYIDLGGKMVRNDFNALLDGEGASCTLKGIYLATGKQHIDNHSKIIHAKPHTNSDEYFKGIIHDRARAVFNGKVLVEKDAQKSCAHQRNKNLLLSDKAEIDTKPQLEIYADDVQCSHGATVGQLDEIALFYLQSRGIGREAAKTLLTYGFLKDLVNQIELAPLKQRLNELCIAYLPQGSHIQELEGI